MDRFTNAIHRKGSIAAASLLLTLASACSKQSMPMHLATISVGDSVVLNHHAVACKAPSNVLGSLATATDKVHEELLNTLRHQDGCYDSAAFLANGQWQVLAKSGTQLRVQMVGYQGEYWVSSGEIAAGNLKTPVSEKVAGQTTPVALATPVTLDEWRKAFGSAYTESQVKQLGDGETTFMASFPQGPNDQVRTFAFGKHDAFSKAYRFIPANSKLEWDLGPSLRTFVHVSEGSIPFVVLSPYYWSRDGYFSLQKLAILVDGELLLEKTLQPDQVTRGHYGVGVTEVANILMTDDDLKLLRKITKESKIAIRLSGRRSYVGIKTNELDFLTSFKRSIIDSLHMYDSIIRATAGHVMPLEQRT